MDGTRFIHQRELRSNRSLPHSPFGLSSCALRSVSKALRRYASGIPPPHRPPAPRCLRYDPSDLLRSNGPWNTNDSCLSALTDE